MSSSSSSGDHKLKHLSIGLIYGFISLLCFLKSDMSAISFDSLMILVSWIALIAMIYSVQWFDNITDGYFILVLLLFFAARLARYSTITIAKPATYIAIGVGMGLVGKCMLKNQGWATIWLLSIFAIEICAMEFELSLVEWKADMTQFFPFIESVDSNIILDPFKL